MNRRASHHLLRTSPPKAPHPYYVFPAGTALSRRRLRRSQQHLIVGFKACDVDVKLIPQRANSHARNEMKNNHTLRIRQLPNRFLSYFIRKLTSALHQDVDALEVVICEEDTVIQRPSILTTTSNVRVHRCSADDDLPPNLLSPSITIR